MSYYDNVFADAAKTAANALASIAIEFKRYNDHKEAEVKKEAAARLSSSRGFG
jgi:hypothetical protein